MAKKSKIDEPFTMGGYRLAEATARGFAEGQLGKEPRPSPESVHFDDMSEDEQMNLLYKIESLVAERRDLTRDLNAEKNGEAEPEPSFVIKMVNGRPTPVPAPKHSPNPFDLTATAAKEHAEDSLTNVKQELLELGKIPGLKAAYENKIVKLWFNVKMARVAQEISVRLEGIKVEREMILQSAQRGKVGAVVGVKRKRLDMLEEEKQNLEEKLGALKTHEGGDLIERFLILKKYGAAAAEGRIIEVPSVSSLVDDGLEAMERGMPFMLAGHLGSGKTEVARHMSRLHMLRHGKGEMEDVNATYSNLEPEIFSGAEEASVYDLIGKLKLSGRVVNTNTIAKQVEELQNELQKKNIRMPDEEAAKVLLGQGNVTETLFSYGPMGRAILEDKPIIIDEINLMPPEVIGRINDILTRKVGERFRLQENGEETFERGPGFAVLATLNLGHQYAGIREFNAAFASRWVGREVDYPTAEEDFDLIIAALIRKDRTSLPPNFPPAAYEQLIDLAVVTREIQELFSGQTEGQRFMAMAKSVSPEKSQLEKVVVSTRDLMRKIVEPFRQDDFKTPLDEIIAKNIIAPAGIQSKDDQAFLVEIFLRRGFFQNWTAQKFAEYGIKSISEKEIETLQAAQQTDEYRAANNTFDEVIARAKQNAEEVKMGLMVGIPGVSRTAKKKKEKTDGAAKAA